MPPERRGSRPTRIGPPKSQGTARPSARASSGLRPSLATPRTPSVPNVIGLLSKEPSSTHDGPRKRPARSEKRFVLALGELRTLAGLLEAVLLSLDGPGVPGEQPRRLQLTSSLLRLLGERPRYAVPQGVGLARGAATLDLGHDVVAIRSPQELQRRTHGRPVGRAGEVLLVVAAVHSDLAVPREQPDARHSGLAPARSPVQCLCHSHFTSSLCGF